MTTYNTGNQVPSTAVKDLYDNAENLDIAVNSQSQTWNDRLGVPRKTWAGMEYEFQSEQETRSERFNDFIASSGYQFIGDYAPGIEITEYNQLVRDSNGEFWRVSGQVDLPYVTTGAGVPEDDALAPMGDAVLRNDLADPDKGARLLGFKQPLAGSLERTVQEVFESEVSVTDFAIGDGVTDDTLAFFSFESVIKGREVDLQGRTYLVSSIPNNNAYFNGSWRIEEFTRSAQLADTFLAGAPKFHTFGGQLRSLVDDLGNPLVQQVGIVFIGDSITWGAGTGESAPTDPRDGTLSDPRDYYGTPSYVNQVKRYIQSRYAPSSTPILSNWAASPSGESTVEYQQEHVLFPRDGAEFSVERYSEVDISTSETLLHTRVGGGVLVLASGNVAVNNSHTIKFSFTGTEFRVYFSTVDSNATYYEILVNGTKVGPTYSMKAGASATSGTVQDGSYNNYYTHTIPFARDAEITIRTVRDGDTGNRIARFQAIGLNKRIIITNQGINGSSFRTYAAYNLSGGYGDGVAVSPQDSYVFVQLGTNDRLIATGNQYPSGQNIVQQYAEQLVAAIPVTAKVIMMVANPTREDPAVYWLTMRDIRDMILRVGRKHELDVIDNYSAFVGVNPYAVASDGVHPNRVGMQVIARNIINSLESA